MTFIRFVFAGRKIMGKFNLDVVPDYSQRYKEKRPASETPTPNPSRSQERQTREATKKSLLDKGGRHSQQAGSSRPLSPASESAKRDEMVNSRASRQVGGCPAGAGPPTNVQGRTGEVSTRKRAVADGPRPEPAKKARVADHRWGYRYVERDIPFVSNADACAKLLCEIGHGPGPFPPLDDLKEKEAYIEAAKKSCEVHFYWS